MPCFHMQRKKQGVDGGLGLHEAMDQIGAILGPLIVSCILYYQGTYQMGFGIFLFRLYVP